MRLAYGFGVDFEKSYRSRIAKLPVLSVHAELSVMMLMSLAGSLWHTTSNPWSELIPRSMNRSSPAEW